MPVAPTVLTDEEFASIKIPALFLVGENEVIYSAKQALARLLKAAPHISSKIIPGAGHDLTFVQTDRVNEAVFKFLSKC
jgi:pimeloyl-ACP methyl ester carboxylesterase